MIGDGPTPQEGNLVWLRWLRLPQGAPCLLDWKATYHVIPERIAPGDSAGDHATVQGGTVTVTRDGETIEAGTASVSCGGVQTANATVGMIDEVLMPPA